jgi:predicted 3-demethylubiquinone-9 3-methyltransferase (glyoxalase superfamily)
MKHQIYPCLWFNGNAKQAADFYCHVFEDCAITSENNMVVNFSVGDAKFMLLNGGPMFKINPSVSFFINCKDADETERLWEGLSAKGKVMMPLNKYPWSESYGWCEDEFGVNWQLMKNNSDQRFVPSMMFTQDKFGRAEEAIKFYTGVFKDSEIKEISKYEKGEADEEGKIKYATFKLNNRLFAAMESSAPHQFTFNEGVSYVVPCDDQQEIDYHWNALCEGGNESQCGWLKDKFGFSWQIIPANLGELMGDPARAKRVMAELMKMKKPDIKILSEA